MGDLTKNISRQELACKCGCGLQSMDWETIEIVQECCNHFATTNNIDRVRLDIHSAARCYKYNRKPADEGGPGSNDRSQHPKCCAIDFHIHGIKPQKVYDYLVQKYPNNFGIGNYASFTHIDSRPDKARW